MMTMILVLAAIGFIVWLCFYMGSDSFRKKSIQVQVKGGDEGIQTVVVTDFDISFMNLVWLMVKASIAAIPAIIILAVVWGLTGMSIMGLLLHAH